jgi:hypothetical protein
MSEPSIVRALETALGQLNLADPEQDADQHLADGDRRAIGIQGYSISFPGLPPDASIPLDQESGYRTIDGTSDCVIGPRHMELIEIATRYAERYNRHIWQRRQDI